MSSKTNQAATITDTIAEKYKQHLIEILALEIRKLYMYLRQIDSIKPHQEVMIELLLKPCCHQVEKMEAYKACASDILTLLEDLGVKI